jgi:hypothetical protein
MPSKPPMLSKSRFLAGLQCPFRLWHQIYNPQLAAEVFPALAPSMKYENPAIREGSMASLQYPRMLDWILLRPPKKERKSRKTF